MAVSLPSRENLVAITRIGTRAEAFQHAVQEIKAIFKRAGVLEQFEDLLVKFDAQSEALSQSEIRAGEPIWTGGQPFMPDGLEEIQTPEVTSASGEPIHVNMSMAFGQDDKLVRGYGTDSGDPDEAMIKGLDALFHGWLKKEGLLCRDQLIYEATESGEIKTDDAGTPIQVDPDVLKTRLLDEASGLKAYINGESASVKFDTVRVKVAEKAEKKADVTQSKVDSDAEPAGPD
jgi:hypothetical protein